MFKRLRLLVLSPLALLFLLLAACGSSSTASTDSGSSTVTQVSSGSGSSQQKKPADPGKHYAIGTTVFTGAWNITVKAVSPYTLSGDDVNRVVLDPNMKLVRLDFTIQNPRDFADNWSFENFETYVAGTTQSLTRPGLTALPDQGGDKLESGKAENVSWVFAVPQNATQLDFVYLATGGNYHWDIPIA